MKRRAVLGWAGLALVSAWPGLADPGFDPVGRWQFHHTDGTTFLARLMPDRTATTSFGGGEWGIWRREATAIRVLYTDGWDDLISLRTDGGFRKRGWAPGADRCAVATNDGPAERLGTEPGAALVGPAAGVVGNGFDAVGRWLLYHADSSGKGFLVRLAPDQTAASDADGGQRGIWRREGDAVRVIFTDGWDDLISRAADGTFRKQAWGPDNDRCGPPAGTGGAKRISADAGPPL